MADHYDQLETRDPAAARAGAVQPAARPRSPGDGQCAGLGSASRGRRCRLRSPRARRSPSCRCCASPTLKDLQAKNPPYGGFDAPSPAGALARIFMSPGRSSSPRASARTGGARRARCSRAGMRKGDIVHNTVRLSPDAGRAGSWTPARARSAAPSSPPAPARPSSSSTSSSTSSPRPTSACRTT